MVPSAFVLAETSVQSPRKLIIVRAKKDSNKIKASRHFFFKFEDKITASHDQTRLKLWRKLSKNEGRYRTDPHLLHWMCSNT